MQGPEGEQLGMEIKGETQWRRRRHRRLRIDDEDGQILRVNEQWSSIGTHN